ncbi:hypothetical protein AYI70_g7129 [Smittium culicis]|uniref:Uncharacterized protein n=1 Tax=Smittium culicis TaxID=133412 RepID=A0A1R1XGX5_9FUNG|nr:hypothetical protein AYI70_g8247 [Smittium culicis]OMJ15646.1 hypothetical protein AYI70_g7129 [Smittium culicis]
MVRKTVSVPNILSRKPQKLRHRPPQLTSNPHSYISWESSWQGKGIPMDPTAAPSVGGRLAMFRSTWARIMVSHWARNIAENDSRLYSGRRNQF